MTIVDRATRTVRSVGHDRDRVDGPLKTTGTARYSTEYPLDDVAYAALVHAAIPKGRVVTIDASDANAVAGVLLVLTHENAPMLKPTGRFNPLDLSTLSPGTEVNYLNTDRVAFDGQPVAMVVAESLEVARLAASLVGVVYAEEPASVDFAEAAQNPQRESRSLGMPAVSGKKGDAEAALISSPFSVDQLFTTPGHSHNALEPHATTAHWDGDQLTVWEGTQHIDWVRRHLAAKFGVPVGSVRVVSAHVGGAFGGKGYVWPASVLAVMAARVVQRPVRLMLTREGVYRTVGGRTPSWQRVGLGADASGRLTSILHTSVAAVGTVGGATEQITSCSRDLYDAPNMAVRQYRVTLDTIPNTSMRAPGESIGSFALESAMDELAHHLVHDPVEFRLRNLATSPPLSRTQRFSHRRIAENIRRGADAFDWQQRRSGAGRSGDVYTGVGMATAFHPAWDFESQAAIAVDESGSVTVRCGFHEMGMGAATALGQAAADLVGVSPDRVTMVYGDTDLPLGPVAGGSGQSAAVAGALERAAADLHDRLVSAAVAPGGPFAGVDSKQARIGDGMVSVGGRSVSFGDVVAASGESVIEGRFGTDSTLGLLAGQARFLRKMATAELRWRRAATGAHFCEVAVDAATFEVRVTRWLGVFDIGRVLNSKTAASQLRGGIVMGLGLALQEQTLVDPRTGRVMNPSLSEYHIPVHADVPDIRIEMLDDPDPTTSMGVIGAGEVGITGAGAAVANAIFNATGARVRHLPITLDKIAAARP